jgi:DNA-binding MarR family transcriptional regulator
MSAERFAPLDPAVHSPVRLAALSVLASVREAGFNHLKEVTATTDGNLSTHLARLEEEGYVKVKKSFLGKKPLTMCRITEKGRQAFASYFEALESYLPPARKKP